MPINRQDALLEQPGDDGLQDPPLRELGPGPGAREILGGIVPSNTREAHGFAVGVGRRSGQQRVGMRRKNETEGQGDDHGDQNAILRETRAGM